MEHSDQQGGQTGVVPVTDLTRRLLRRATEPIGVIDVRQGADLHARSTLGRRSELLDNLKRRYGLDQDPGGAAGTASLAAGGMPFISALHSMAAGHLDLPPAPALAVRPAMSASATGNAFVGSPVPSAPEYRVKRPARVTEHDRPGQQASPATTERSPAAGTLRIGTTAVPSIQRQRTVGDAPSRGASEPAPSALPLAGTAPVDAPRHEVGRPAPRLEPRDDGFLSRISLPQVSELPPVVSTTQSYVQRKADGSGVAESAGLMPAPSAVRPASAPHGLPGDDPEPSTGSSGAPSRGPPADVLPRSSVDHPPTLGGAAGEIASLVMARRSGPASRGADPPIDGAPTAIALPSRRARLQRKADHAPTAAAAGPAQTPALAPPPVAAGSQSREAVSAEIRTAPLQPASTRIVWRKADINGAGRESASPGPAARLDPTHAGTQVMRQTTSDSTSGSTGASAPPVMAPAHGSGGIDVARLAEQVSRIIARQLTIERERRGRTR